MGNNQAIEHNDQSSGADNRAYTRYPTNLAAEIFGNGPGAVPCTISNFCIGGLYLIYTTSPTPTKEKQAYTPTIGDIIRIKSSLNIENTTKKIILQGRVVFADKHSAGIAFINPDLDTLNELHKYAVVPLDNISPVEEDHSDDLPNDNSNEQANDLSQTLVEKCNDIVTASAYPMGVRFYNIISDKLYKMAEQSHSIQQQNEFFEALKIIKSQKETFLSSLVEEIESKLINYSPNKVLSDDQANFDHNEGSLSLVEDDVLDYWLADSIANENLEREYRETLFELEKRLSIIYGEPIKKDNNPFGPLVFTHSFHNSIRKLGMTHNNDMACYDILQPFLIDELDSIYNKLNKLLIENEIMPVVKYTSPKITEDQSKHSSDRQTSANNEHNTQPLEAAEGNYALTATTNQQRKSENITNLYRLVGELQNMQTHLSQSVEYIANVNKTVASEPISGAEQNIQPSEFSANELIKALSSIPVITQADPEQTNHYKPKLLDTLAKQSNGSENRVIGVRESQIMGVAGNIFQSLLQDKQVADDARHYIKQLEVPALKIALADDTLFTKKTHPVRQVINKIAELEVLADGSDGATKSLVTKALDWMINLINSEVDQDDAVFDRATQQLNLLVRAQDTAYNHNIKQVIQECELDPELQQIVLETKLDNEILNSTSEKANWEKWLKRARRLNENMWIVFNTDDGSSKRSRLAWIAPKTEQYVFVNSLGNKDFVIHVHALAAHLKDGKAIVLDNADEPAVDRAQYSMLQNLHEQLLHQSTHDQLTGLMTRREFEGHLNDSLIESKGDNTRHVLCIVDIDQFNVVNSKCGHDGGDALLLEISEKLNNAGDEDTIIARIGVDEFAILLTQCSLDEALEKTERYFDIISEYRFKWKQEELTITLSAGLASITATNANTTELLQAAETSCKMASEGGGDNIQIYYAGRSKISEKNKAKQWASVVNTALEKENFALRCQKIVPIQDNSNELTYHEILLGVFDQEGNNINVQEFVQAAETYHRAQELDRWVILNTFKWIVDNPDLTKSTGGFSINLSGHSLNDEHLMDFVKTQIRETGVPTNKICFEITETAEIANLTDAAEFIREIKETGCTFSLDDFGSGMSSYAYLKNLPVDYLKIDGQFVKDIETNTNDLAVVKSICEIGHFMGKKVIAEFVESTAILEILKDLGVDFAQGYGIEKPQLLNKYRLLN